MAPGPKAIPKAMEGDVFLSFLSFCATSLFEAKTLAGSESKKQRSNEKRALLFTVRPISFSHVVGQPQDLAENLMVTPPSITWYTVGLYLPLRDQRRGRINIDERAGKKRSPKGSLWQL